MSDQRQRSVEDELAIAAGKTALRIVGGLAFMGIMTAIGLPHVGVAGGTVIAGSGHGDDGHSDDSHSHENFDLSDWYS
jgi:hypothetical protein